MRRHAVGEIAGRRAAERLESELDGARGGDRDDAILVRERRMIDGIVLEIQLADAERLREAIGFDERRESRIEAGARLAVDRQQLAIAPQVLRARLDLRAAHVAPDLVVVVDDFERSETLVAHPQRLCRKHRLAQVTLQSGYVSHISFIGPAEAGHVPRHRHRHRAPHVKRQRVDLGERRIQHRHRARLERHHERQLGFVVAGKLQNRVDVDAVGRQKRSQRSNDTRTVGHREAHVVRGRKIDAHLDLPFELLRQVHFGAESRARNRHQIGDDRDGRRIAAGAKARIRRFAAELAVAR